MTKLCARDGSVLLNVTVTDCPAFAVSVASSNLSWPFVTPTARVVLAAVPVDVLTPVAPGLPPPVLVLPPQAVRANNPPGPGWSKGCAGVLSWRTPRVGKIGL